MCNMNIGPNKRARIDLIEIDQEKAKKMGCEPGFKVLLLAPKSPEQGYRREEIRKIVLWQNASHGYLGLNYQVWPWYKKIAAHWRILVCWLDRLHQEDEATRI